MRNIYEFENGYIDFQDQLGSFDEWDEAVRPVNKDALPPNKGISANLTHWLFVEKLRQGLKNRGWKNIRVDQQQVKTKEIKPDGRVVEQVAGINRPDISATHPITKKRLNIEVDTKRRQSIKHQREVCSNDPSATSQFILINKKGKVISSRICRPNKGMKAGRKWPL